MAIWTPWPNARLKRNVNPKVVWCGSNNPRQASSSSMPISSLPPLRNGHQTAFSLAVFSGKAKLSASSQAWIPSTSWSRWSLCASLSKKKSHRKVSNRLLYWRLKQIAGTSSRSLLGFLHLSHASLRRMLRAYTGRSLANTSAYIWLTLHSKNDSFTIRLVC